MKTNPGPPIFVLRAPAPLSELPNEVRAVENLEGVAVQGRSLKMLRVSGPADPLEQFCREHPEWRLISETGDYRIPETRPEPVDLQPKVQRARSDTGSDRE